MARGNEINITPSILDRLTDYDPGVKTEPARSRVQNLRDLKQTVRRDLENLLNARSFTYHIDDDLEEVNNSLAVFGLPDFTGISSKDPAEQNRMTRAIEDAITIFEPRFIGVKVNLEPVSTLDKQLKFRIEASLNVEPAPEPVVFDTVLELDSGQFGVIEK
jgi:type VI secretion system protein ImpF